MGSFDCYCAFCSGPLGIYFVSFGSKKAKALRKRRKRVGLHSRRLAGEDVHEDRKPSTVDDDEEMEAFDEEEDPDLLRDPKPYKKPEEPSWGDDEDEVSDDDYEQESVSSTSTDVLESVDSDLHTGHIPDVQRYPDPSPEPEPEPSDAWSQASDITIWDEFNPFHNKSETGSMYEYYENNAYDPEVVDTSDVRWLNRCRCLAFNPNAPGVTKAFITGRGRYDDYGSFEVRKEGRDPNDTGINRHTCFYAYDSNEIASFPFHESCFIVFAKSLGYEDVRRVDKDVLYGVISSFITDYAHVPGLNYGLVQYCGQGWECLPGEEYCVFDPATRYDNELQSILPARLFESPARLVGLEDKVGNDPLSVLPYDILHGIFGELSIKDTMALMKASYYVLSSTSDAAFWRNMLRVRFSPWLWELAPLLNTLTLPSSFDYKALFLWLNKITIPEFNIRGPLLGLANRRRIHNACQPIASLYKERVIPESHHEPEDDEAKSILGSATSLHMPMVSYPQPQSAHTIFAQFIRSWAELRSRASDFDTYWNIEGGLVGIAVTFGFGGEQRVFGSTQGRPGHPLHIEASEWISEIRVHILDVDMLNEQQDRSFYTSAMDTRPARDSYIHGMTVVLTSGRSKQIKSGRGHVRPFVVLPYMHLVGLTGQIGTNGVISRLGLLQASRPDDAPRTPLAYDFAQQTLWSRAATEIPRSANTYEPIWTHPHYHLHSFVRYANHGSVDLPSDILAHQIMLWAETPAQCKDVTSISCFTIMSGLVNRGSKEHEREKWDIVGMSHMKRKVQHGNFIGIRGPVPAQADNWTDVAKPSDLDLHSRFKPFEEANMRHFEIDGPGGEIVSEVHVSEDFKAVKLITNRGRECYWGEGERNQWLIEVAKEGELIVGLSACFGRLSGWSWTAKMYSHWKLSHLGVVTMSVDTAMGGS